MAIDILGTLGGSGITTGVILVAFWLFVFFFLAVIVAAIWFFHGFLNIKVYIIERLGDKGYKIKKDRARVMKKKSEPGIIHLKLFWSKKELLPPDNSLYGLERKTQVVFYSKIGEDYSPASISFTDNTSIQLHQELNKRMIWMTERKRQQEKFDPKNFWDKYGTAITILGTLLICFLILVVSFKQQSEIVSSSEAAARSLENGIARLVDLIRTNQI